MEGARFLIKIHVKASAVQYAHHIEFDFDPLNHTEEINILYVMN